MAGMIKRSGRYNYRVVESTNKECTIEFTDLDEVVGTSTFDEADAKAAGLAGKESWRKWPKAMYYNRAMSQGARMYCPDIFLGAVYDEGEIEMAAPKNTPPPEPSGRKPGLVAAVNIDDGVYGDVEVYQPLDEEPETKDNPHPSEPEPMEDDQRKSLLYHLMRCGAVENSKRELLDIVEPTRASAAVWIDYMRRLNTIPDGMFVPYVKMLRERVGITKEDVSDYCQEYFKQPVPTKLSSEHQRQLIGWLMIAQEEENDISDHPFDMQAKWREACNVSDEMLAKMSDEEVEESVNAWIDRQTEAV
jgi:hypothetical protein